MKKIVQQSPKKLLVMVCNSQKPKQFNVGCCYERNAEEVLEALNKKVPEDSETIIIRETACLNNCADGVSVKIFPGGNIYSNVTPDQVDDLLGIS